MGEAETRAAVKEFARIDLDAVERGILHWLLSLDQFGRDQDACPAAARHEAASLSSHLALRSFAYAAVFYLVRKWPGRMRNGRRATSGMKANSMCGRYAFYVACAFGLGALDCSASDCGIAGARLVMDFDVVADQSAEIDIPTGLQLSINSEWGLGFQLIVSKARTEENLLVRNPHGPDYSDLFASTHYWKVYPNIRRFPVPGHNVEVIVDLRDVQTELSGEETLHPEVSYGGQLPAKFVGGALHICWKPKGSRPHK